MAFTPTGVKTGHLLICDFDRGFVQPEMVKTRPVVVISKTKTHSRGLCTVVPLSTTSPHPVEMWHVALQHYPLGSDRQVWAKCDMLYTVSFERLQWPHTKRGGKREYQKLRLGDIDLDAVFAGIRSYLPASTPVISGVVSASICADLGDEVPPWA